MSKSYILCNYAHAEHSWQAIVQDLEYHEGDPADADEGPWVGGLESVQWFGWQW